jgi:hypothetical protein
MPRRYCLQQQQQQQRSLASPLWLALARRWQGEMGTPSVL